MKTLYPETLPSQTAVLVKRFQEQKPSFLHNFYLSGGTALSLQLGHRESEDLDFFCTTDFQPQKLQEALTLFGTLEELELAEGTLNAFLNGVKVQFLAYPYDLLEPVLEWEGIRLSSITDIACTKLQTVGMRGSKKDFIDLYFLFQQYPLKDLFELMEKKYHNVEYSQAHILKSLVYFDDANMQPMPRMHKQSDWDEVKEKMVEVVKSISFT